MKKEFKNFSRTITSSFVCFCLRRQSKNITTSIRYVWIERWWARLVPFQLIVCTVNCIQMIIRLLFSRLSATERAYFIFILFELILLCACVCVCVFFFFASCVFGCLISALCARIVYTLQKKGKVLSTVHSKFTSIHVKHASLEHGTWNGHVARPSSRHFPKLCFCRFYTIQHIWFGGWRTIVA